MDQDIDLFAVFGNQFTGCSVHADEVLALDTNRYGKLRVAQCQLMGCGKLFFHNADNVVVHQLFVQKHDPDLYERAKRDLAELKEKGAA